ncbi:MAG: diguanylate cyclase [Nitrospirae bacterium]|nr:diguanylate cyclase [Nitrospirota bacterium]
MDRQAKEFRRLLLSALKREGFYFFDNPHLVKCWEEMRCDKTGCASYGSDNLRCWHASGTFCKGKPQGNFAKKFGDCQKCRVYKKAVSGGHLFQIGEDFNNLMFQLRTKEEELKLNLEKLKRKNRELSVSNEKISKLLKRLDKRNTRLKELSIRDGLTGLYNFRYFGDILHEQFKLAERYKFPLSCIIIDIDYFKAVNDTYGHQAGDEILKELAKILRENSRETDKAVRYGGEEFVMLLPYSDNDDAFTKAEMIRNSVHDHSFKAGKNSLRISISLGIANFPGNSHIKNAKELVGYADKALYMAKERGRNQSVISLDKSFAREIEKKPEDDALLSERRSSPRVKVLIKIKGEINRKEITFPNVFDISSHGLSLLSSKPLNADKGLKIKLLLPQKGEKTSQVNIEGEVVWCRQVDRRQKAKPKYLVGIKYRKISEFDLKLLEKFFISIFRHHSPKRKQ